MTTATTPRTRKRPGTWETARLNTRRNLRPELAGPVCRARVLHGKCADDSCRDLQFARVPTAELRRAVRDRKLANPSRDKNANPGNAKGYAYENPEMRQFADRAIAAYARRVGAGDIAELANLVALHDVVEAAIGEACRALVQPAKGRDDRYSWTDVGNVLDVDRRSAWDAYHDPAGNRRLRGTQLNGRNGQNGQAA